MDHDRIADAVSTNVKGNPLFAVKHFGHGSIFGFELLDVPDFIT
jgi:hypothetical protein